MLSMITVEDPHLRADAHGVTCYSRTFRVGEDDVARCVTCGKKWAKLELEVKEDEG